jgi:hypothetical protein
LPPAGFLSSSVSRVFGPLDHIARRRSRLFIPAADSPGSTWNQQKQAYLLLLLVPHRARAAEGTHAKLITWPAGGWVAAGLWRLARQALLPRNYPEVCTAATHTSYTTPSCYYQYMHRRHVSSPRFCREYSYKLRRCLYWRSIRPILVDAYISYMLIYILRDKTTTWTWTSQDVFARSRPNKKTSDVPMWNFVSDPTYRV